MAFNVFQQLPVKAPKRNFFDLTHDVKLTFNMGELIPCCALECVPGDVMTISGEALLKFQPLVAPVMHRMDLTIHYFFVPNRILWNHWEKYITGGDVAQGQSNVAPVHPYIRIHDTSPISPRLADYFGLPIDEMMSGSGGNYDINALPFAAYQKIYMEYYRDQNLIKAWDDLQNAEEYSLFDGLQSPSFTTMLCQLRYRAWEHDYFTGCLPFAQKGPAVNLPLGEFQDVPVKALPYTGSSDTNMHLEGTSIPSAASTFANVPWETTSLSSLSDGDLYADMTDAIVAATTVEDLRRAYRLQEWLEKSARVGTRYVEHLAGFWGIPYQDVRLNRPEYITGIKTPIVISEILNTAGVDTGDPDTTLPQGNMSGHAMAVTTGGGKTYSVKEHGWLIGIMSVRPKTSYQQGIHKKFLRIGERYDYYWSQFANIGEQAVQNQEIFALAVDREATFGYVPRYAEYKFQPNYVCGAFKTSLKHWTITRIFITEPALNQTFIECTPRNDIFAVTSGSYDNLYCIILNKVHAIRPMPKFGVPVT